MEAYDPSTWTTAYVEANTAECLSRLRNAVGQSVDAIESKNYAKAVTGLGYTLMGLETIQESPRCGNYTPHLCLLSWYLGNLIAITGVGPDGSKLSDADRCEGAIALYEDAYEVAAYEEMKKSLGKNISLLQSGCSPERFRSEVEPDFPRETVKHLKMLISELYPLHNTAASSSSSGGCYVATAVYGSYDCPEVWTLRRYRDNTMAKTWAGRLFIRTYYALSPSLVKWFGHTAWFKSSFKSKLDKMVQTLNASGVENTPYEDSHW